MQKVGFFLGKIYFANYLSAPCLFKQHVMRAVNCRVISAKYILFVPELATPHKKTLHLAIHLQRVKKTRMPRGVKPYKCVL